MMIENDENDDHIDEYNNIIYNIIINECYNGEHKRREKDKPDEVE